MVRIEWDENKNQANLIKHRIDFQTAQLVFDDPNCVNFVERITEGEQRWHAVGLVQDLVLVLVVHTYHDSETGEVIRIVSARQATRYERKLYETHG